MRWQRPRRGRLRRIEADPSGGQPVERSGWWGGCSRGGSSGPRPRCPARSGECSGSLPAGGAAPLAPLLEPVRYPQGGRQDRHQTDDDRKTRQHQPPKCLRDSDPAPEPVASRSRPPRSTRPVHRSAGTPPEGAAGSSTRKALAARASRHGRGQIKAAKRHADAQSQEDAQIRQPGSARRNGGSSRRDGSNRRCACER